MKRRKKAAGCVGIALLAILMIGCGDSGKEASPSTKNVSVREEKPDETLKSTEDDISHIDDIEKEMTTLIGSVKSIEKNSRVIRQAFEDGEDVLVEPAEGSPDETLVTVTISETTQYEVKTVKNSGVNGDSDIERREGSFSDLEENVSVNISGYYEGETFWAEKIFIMLFV